jgi:hypothetical protein
MSFLQRQSKLYDYVTCEHIGTIRLHLNILWRLVPARPSDQSLLYACLAGDPEVLPKYYSNLLVPSNITMSLRQSQSSHRQARRRLQCSHKRLVFKDVA